MIGRPFDYLRDPLSAEAGDPPQHRVRGSSRVRVPEGCVQMSTDALEILLDLKQLRCRYLDLVQLLGKTRLGLFPSARHLSI